ncbi:Frizzy aggregation protein FrzCD [compost metagenome]
MTRAWTFGQQLAVGFAVPLLLTMVIGGVSAVTLASVVTDKDALVTHFAGPIHDTQRLNTLMAETMSANRGYLLTKNPDSLAQARESGEAFEALMADLAVRLPEADQAPLARIRQASDSYRQAMAAAIQARQAGGSLEAASSAFEREVRPKSQALKDETRRFGERKAADMEAAKRASTQRAEQAAWLVVAMALLAVALAMAIAVVLTRVLSRRIGSAVHHLQSSSTELQAAANQQATGSGQQATAMTEVSTTMTELLATSKQIAESAQRVAAIADETAAAAGAGDRTVHEALEAVQLIRRQVDQIVAHMLDLGQKSQQIGGILAIIKELAEQTNILSINATIEAAGAGDAGKRFAAVAEAIRKLADRVSDSTGEIGALIQEMRAATNTTVMAAENGSKAVDAGMRQFGELGAGFQRIVALVDTTAEAAREIELSTKQQSSAVEQVHVAIQDAAQAAKETQASSHQTLQTSSQLATVSGDLARLLRAPAGT